MDAAPNRVAGADRLRAQLQPLRILMLNQDYTHPTFADLVLTHSRDHAPSLADR